VAAPAVATAAVSRPLLLPLAEALASVAVAAIGVWSAVASVDAASVIVGVGLLCTDAKASGVPAASCMDHCERPVPAALDVVDAFATSSVVSDALASVVATVLAPDPESEPAGKALTVASAGMDAAIWLVPTVGMPRSVAAIVWGVAVAAMTPPIAGADCVGAAEAARSGTGAPSVEAVKTAEEGNEEGDTAV